MGRTACGTCGVIGFGLIGLFNAWAFSGLSLAEKAGIGLALAVAGGLLCSRFGEG